MELQNAVQESSRTHSLRQASSNNLDQHGEPIDTSQRVLRFRQAMENLEQEQAEIIAYIENLELELFALPKTRAYVEQREQIQASIGEKTMEYEVVHDH